MLHFQCTYSNLILYGFFSYVSILCLFTDKRQNITKTTWCICVNQFIIDKRTNSTHKHYSCSLGSTKIPIFNNYLLCYYIIAAVKRCFQLPVQSVSGQELVMIVNVQLRAHRHPSKAPAANHEVILSESLGRTFWKMGDNPQSVKPWCFQAPIISCVPCLTTISVSVTLNNLAGWRLICGSKRQIIPMPPWQSNTAQLLHLNSTYALDCFQMNENEVEIQVQRSGTWKIWMF